VKCRFCDWKPEPAPDWELWRQLEIHSQTYHLNQYRKVQSWLNRTETDLPQEVA
jgi:hypothetical protein